MNSASKPIMSTLHKNALVSPPEAAPYDSFISPTLTTTRYNSSEAMPGIKHHSPEKMDISPPAAGPPKNMASLLSPPLSPFNVMPQASSEPAAGVTDPTLFSAPSSPALASQRPLFDDAEQFADLISKRAEDPKKPTPQEYSVFVSAAFELCQRDPKQWAEREKRYISKTPTQWTSLNRIQKSRVQKISAVPTTPARVLAPARKSNLSTSPPKSQRPPRTPKAPKQHGSYEAFVRDARVTSPSTASVRTRQPATREDTDFEAIEDMCPPLSTLNENSKFRVEWKGTPLDLCNDPHKDLLHPAELHLASVLRLSCASYLTSKRRIFREKIERARHGMEFRKTDSQKACKIDVNKASKLWAAYEKIGWFDYRYIAPYLQAQGASRR